MENNNTSNTESIKEYIQNIIDCGNDIKRFSRNKVWLIDYLTELQRSCADFMAYLSHDAV